MSKLIVSVNSYEQINQLVDKDIYGFMLYIDKLSVNSSFYINIDDINNINFNGKRVLLVMNKIMHNSDLGLVRDILYRVKDMDVKIMFYDMAVYNISKEFGIIDKLVIYQDHLNASISSNRFYNGIGINGSYVSSDITGSELLDIKNNSNMEIYFTGYGYLPIFYSRRYLIKNYLKYIQVDNDCDNYSIVSDMGNRYPIDEEEFGTTIYSERPVNLINQLKELDKIDYIVMNSNGINDNEFNLMVDKFINRCKLDDCYLGFYNTKTIFKVKNGI